MKAVNYLLWSVVFLIFGCSNHVKIERIELDPKFQKIASEAKMDSIEISRVSISKLTPNSDWDEVAILSPYIMRKELEDAGIIDYNQIFDDLENINDSKCSLLFLKEKRVIGYSIISRAPIDFSQLKLLKSVVLLNKRDCDRLRLRKTKSGFDLFLEK